MLNKYIYIVNYVYLDCMMNKNHKLTTLYVNKINKTEIKYKSIIEDVIDKRLYDCVEKSISKLEIKYYFDLKDKNQKRILINTIVDMLIKVVFDELNHPNDDERIIYNLIRISSLERVNNKGFIDSVLNDLNEKFSCQFLSIGFGL